MASVKTAPHYIVRRREMAVQYLDSIGQPQDGHVILRLEQILTGLDDEIDRLRKQEVWLVTFVDHGGLGGIFSSEAKAEEWGRAHAHEWAGDAIQHPEMFYVVSREIVDQPDA
jgi:hypothetical protein